MENKINNNELDKIGLDITNIESFLTTSGYLTQKLWTKKNSDLFDWSKVNDILLGFEYNEKISATEASVKYGDKIQWMNKIFKIDTTLEELHRQYVHYTSTNISFIKFLNNFVMLEIILNNYYNVINRNNEQDINTLFNQEIIMNDIDINSSLHDKNILGLKQKLQLIYTKINKNSSYNGKDVNPKLICILFLLSVGSSFSVDQNIPHITNLMNLFILYNKIYVNDINLSLILFLNVIICINLYIYANKKKNQFKFLNFDNTNYSNYYYQDLKKKNNIDKNKKVDQNEDKKNYISLFLFDNDTITYNGGPFFDLLIFQNYLKIFTIYHLSKNQIKMTINLTIDTIVETLKTFYENITIISNTNNIQTNINIDINTNDNNNHINNKIKCTNLLLLTKNNINKCFASFNFNELLIKVTNYQDENQIRAINSKYLELIQKSKKLYLQNSITTINQINVQKSNNNIVSDNKIDDNTSIDSLLKEIQVFIYLLNFLNKNKEVKKNLQFYCFKFTFFKCSIFKEGQKEIQVFFDYSSIKERYLLKYLKDILNILFLIKQFEQILHILNEYKLYNIIFRVCQTSFRSRHINFYFSIIIKKLVSFIEDNKYNRITIYDSKLKTYEQNMFVYIKDKAIKQKSRISSLKEMFTEPIFSNKLKVFIGFVKELVDDWDIIIIGEDIKYHNIIYSHNVNILFINIVKETNDNSVQNFMKGSSIIKGSIMNIGMSVNPNGQGDDRLNQVKENIINFEYLNILMYITNDEDFADKILKFSEDLKNNNNLVLRNKITLICERFFFEEKIIMNSRVKEGKQIYNCIDNYCLVCDTKKKQDVYKYDLYITKNYISFVNHIKQEITNNFNDLIYGFISSLSSCIELILYLLKNKEIDPPSKFYYILRIEKDYYLFQYKLGNIFVKKLKSFDSLMLLNPKKSIPLLCLLTDKHDNTDNSNENFFDTFLRLFLNLNKVVESNQLNENFFEKIHKNMFYQNYETFKLAALSYDAFCTFNDLFINNNYLQIYKNDKFEICYIFPFETESEQKIQKFKKILEYQKNNQLIVKNIKIYDYNLTSSFIFKNVNELKMNYQKVEYFINYQKSSNEIQNSIKAKLIYVYKKLNKKKFEKKNVKKIMKNIKELYFENDCVSFYNCNTSDIEKLLFEFNAEQANIKAVKLDHRAFHI